MSSLLIIDKFLWSVVVLMVLNGYQKRCRTPGPSGDEFSRPDYIFAGLGPPRISHTALKLRTVIHQEFERKYVHHFVDNYS